MYKWRITLTNNKEYIIQNDLKDLSDMVTYVFGKCGNTVSFHTTDSTDLKNKCKNVMINSNAVASIEYNL